MIDLTDTHCHIHEAEDDFQLDTETKRRYQKAQAAHGEVGDFVTNARTAGVSRLICVGTTVADSKAAIAFAARRPGVWAAIGIHPHEAEKYATNAAALQEFADLAVRPKVVAVGECGLDFYYNHSPADDQEKILRLQLELALKHQLPLIFHVREAFPEFWKIIDDYKGVKGVIHSFSATQKELDHILERELYVGLNGIMTFTKDAKQLEAARNVPLERLLLETDAPFLTPDPYRGTMCEPKHVRITAEFLAKLRGESLEALATRTTANAQTLFGIV